MTIHEPFAIGSRLLPMLKISDGELSLEFLKWSADGRMVYRWYVDIPAGEFSGDDLRSGCQGCTTQEMFGTFLAFLGAAAESHGYTMRTGRESENGELFPLPVVEWAYQHSDEIDMIRLEIEESGETFIED